MSLLNTIGGHGHVWAAEKVKAKAFAHADSNGDKSLDQTELQATFDAVAARTGKTALDAEAAIAKADLNGDGVLNRIEVRAQVRELRAEARSTIELARRDGAAS